MDSTYNSKLREQAAQEFWEDSGVYSAENNPGPLYSIDTPPPTVSGSLHIGHVFSYTQADIFARYKRMSGFSVFYPIGFDDNGLATERFVEKKLKINPLHIGRAAFIEACLKETAQTEKQFEKLWRKLGLSFDWSASYSTINTLSRKISQKSFIELYRKKFIYRKDEPAPYCATCRTSVAQAELDDKEVPSLFSDIVFKDGQGNDLIVATTRPELLSSCVALLYNPEDSRYKKLQGSFAKVPLYDFDVPIIPEASLQIDKGTGLAMCCTFGDKADVAWYKNLQLPYKPSIGHDGRMNEHARFVTGKKVIEARAHILELLEKNNLIRNKRAIVHVVNIHERCGQEIEYLAFPQWFISILPYKQIFIELGDQISWYPPFMKARFKNWVENLGWDWCISRQRFYGIPFPVWYCKSCEAVLIPEEKDLPLDPQETQYFSACSFCGSHDILPDTDVMDTWNTSSLTPYICRALYKDGSHFIPMSMRPQAHDIIRTWAFYTLVKSWMHDQTIPWREIIISGHVVAKGAKISKSQDNSPLAPEKLLELYPADAIRFWTASATLGQDVVFSDNQLRIGQRLVVKLWNAFRLIHEHAPDNIDVLLKDVSIVHTWISSRLVEATKDYHAYFTSGEIALALQSVEKFFWHDFCDNYLEIIKDYFFHPERYTAREIEITQWMIREIGLRILQLFSPYVPHITETLFSLLYKQSQTVSSIHQLRFSALPSLPYNPEDAEKMDAVLDVIKEVRRLKSEHHISLKTDIHVLHITAEPSICDILRTYKTLFMPLTRALDVQCSSSEGDTSRLVEHDGKWQAFIVIKKR